VATIGKIMTQALNTKAADHHDEAAKLHRDAAASIGKGDHAAAKDCCGKAVAKSDDAHKASVTAQTKTAAAPMKK
jgi:hypothetical protein